MASLDDFLQQQLGDAPKRQRALQRKSTDQTAEQKWHGKYRDRESHVDQWASSNMDRAAEHYALHSPLFEAFAWKVYGEYLRY